mmetsp:Transcript_24342/g.59598  ORF Transcript_24342/g.59598 Transcript_24342/m.59598 type:complete len:201 (-) Transcript_24342:306-908(-)
MNVIELIQFGLSFFQFLFQISNRCFDRNLFLETFQLTLVFTNSVVVLGLHVCLLFFQEFQLLAQFEFGSTAVFDNLGNFLLEGSDNFFTRLFDLSHLVSGSVHLLDRLGKLGLQLHNVLGIHTTLGCNTLDEVGVFVNGVLVLHVLFQGFKALFNGLCLALQAFHFNTMQDGFLHLAQSFFFQFLLQGSKFLVLFQASLF